MFLSKTARKYAFLSERTSFCDFSCFYVGETRGFAYLSLQKKLDYLFFDMKNASFIFLLLCSALLCACGGGGEKKSDEAADTVAAEQAPQVPVVDSPDTTVYGRADGFGQGGFALVADDGRLLELSLTSEADGSIDGHYARIYGDRDDTARYAVTIAPDGEAAATVINLSQLDRFTSHYRIHNGTVIITDGKNEDPVEIEQLDDHAFRAKGKSGKTYQFRR